ncbi:chorismate synthase, partial [candidate division KSB1 bacterium]|nr:chorismate synthase [candidate division KSB1 bacterium]
MRYLTAGESHGQGLVGILEGIPAGLEITEEDIAVDLKRRQMGHGRGGRMKIEQDKAQIFSGVRFGKTLGSPIALILENKDWKNWQTEMSVKDIDESVKQVSVPRPGHADLAGAVKYGHRDIRNVLERASARETAMRVALGAIASKFLAEFSIKIVSHVLQIHSIRNSFTVAGLGEKKSDLTFELSGISDLADRSPVRCLDGSIEKEMIAKIDQAKKDKNTVGGIFEVACLNLPIGLGSHVHWDRKLDARISHAMMSIPAMKGVEIGLGFEAGTRFGSEVHDQIYYDKDSKKYFRSSNGAGGLEGGITNGMPLVVRVAMKPISTLMRPLDSVDMATKEQTEAHVERSDVCAVPAASIIGEAILALVLTEAFLEKFGGDSIEEITRTYKAWEKNSN